MTILLKNANIVPLNADVVLDGHDVLIEKSQIARIGRDLSFPGAQVVDCGGKYLMPGLWDMHAHPTVARYLGLFLANGVTTVRNLWGLPSILQWRDEIAAGKRIGPTLYSTSPLMDGVDFWEGSLIVKTPEDAHTALDQAVKDGYTEIKIYPSIPREAYFALMQRAKDLGLRVVGHANTSVSADELIESGYHTIEHASILFTASGQSEENVIKVARSGIWLTPTLVVVWMMIGCTYEGLDPITMPHNEFASDEEKSFWRSFTPTIGEIVRKRNLNKADISQLTRLFVQNSDNVLLGTDQGNPGIIAGFSLHEELELNVSELGLTPYQALRLGTVNAARYYGVERETGTVEEGKTADLLLVEGNPLENITHTRRLAAVIKAGAYYHRQALENMKQDALPTHAPDTGSAVQPRTDGAE